MIEYKKLVEYVLNNGARRGDRTGTGTISVFGAQTRYDLREGFPLVTLKKTNFESIVKELLWFLRGETNIKTLGCGIWNEWADEDGELGPVYGKQWREFNEHSCEYCDRGQPNYYDILSRKFDPPCAVCKNIGFVSVDQIANLIQGLREKPLSRRHIVTAWNPAEVDQMALPPCHTMFQMYASEIPREDIGGKIGFSSQYFNINGSSRYYLDLQLYQRSADLALGVPFNIASYSLLLMLIAREVNMIPRFFIHTIGDAHIYENHIEGVKEMLSREPLSLPTVTMADKPLPYPRCPRDGSVLEPEDFKLINYECHPFIRFSVAV